MIIQPKFKLLIFLIFLLSTILFAENTPYRENYMDTLWTQYGEILETDCAKYGQQVVSIDYNGDSIDDLIVEAGNSGNPGFRKIYFYEGGSAFDNIPEFTWYHVITDTTSTYPYWIRNIGDFNGDGFEDLMTVSHFYEYPIYKQSAQVYFCGPDFEFEPDWEYEVEFDSNDAVTYYHLGDINGDGYSDIGYLYRVNYSLPNSNNFNLMYCIKGDAEYPTVEYFASMGITRDSTTYCPSHIFPINDVNNDNFDDFMVKYYDPVVGHPRNYLYYGSTTPDTLADLSFEVLLDAQVGFGCGDYNNDGFNDFLGDTWGDNRFWYGTNLPLNENPDLHLSDSGMPDGHAYGDLNNDGYDEIIMANRNKYLYDGEVYIFVGGTTNSISYDLSLYTHNMELDWAFGKFGTSIACGDFNNDGYDDIAVGAPDPAGTNPFPGPSKSGCGKVFVFAGNENLAETDQVGVNSIHVSLPQKVSFQAYPNPFNPVTQIAFSIPEESNVKLSIFNITGQKVKTLVDDKLEAGSHSVEWNSEDTAGKSVASGIYFYKLRVNDNTVGVKKMLLLK